MVKAAQLWHCRYRANRLDVAGQGSVFVQTEMRAIAVVVFCILAQEFPKMQFTQHNNMILQSSPDKPTGQALIDGWNVW